MVAASSGIRKIARMLPNNLCLTICVCVFGLDHCRLSGIVGLTYENIKAMIFVVHACVLIWCNRSKVGRKVPKCDIHTIHKKQKQEMYDVWELLPKHLTPFDLASREDKIITSYKAFHFVARLQNSSALFVFRNNYGWLQSHFSFMIRTERTHVNKEGCKNWLIRYGGNSTRQARWKKKCIYTFFVLGRRKKSNLLPFYYILHAHGARYRHQHWQQRQRNQHVEQRRGTSISNMHKIPPTRVY